MTPTIDFLTTPHAPCAVDQGRALTRVERDWLAAVPVDPRVERSGDASTSGMWAGTFFRTYIRWALEMGQASVAVEDGVLVATFKDKEYRVRKFAGSSAASSPAAVDSPQRGPAPAMMARVDRPRRPFFPLFCPGTYASHSAPND